MLKTIPLCSWPIKFLQDNLYGICTNDLVVIGCDSGVGKSTLSRMITRQARNEGCPVVLYSLENAPGTFVAEEVMLEYCKDTHEEMNSRQFEIAHSADPDKYKPYRQKVFGRWQQTTPDGVPLLVVHEQVSHGDWTIQRLIPSMKEEIKKGYKLFIIDHLDVLVQRDELTDTKNAMDELWDFVQENQVAVVTFSQIVKGCHALCPCCDDLRGHKAKVYKSTIIVTLAKHEYGYYNPPHAFPHAKPTYVRIAKSRSTSTGCAVCYFNGGSYLDTYLDVLCDTPGNYIDGMTRDKLQKHKIANQRLSQWD
jgi:archaellum biogenesis ATPase FlaH